jgi:hypothetical protein
MGCAIRIYNHLPRVKMAQNLQCDWARMRIATHPIEALLCLHGSVAPITDLEWATAVMCGIGASELRLWADNDQSVGRIFGWRHN